MNAIQYLQRTQIDTEKWDRCIAGASNGLIYARSISLDHMAANWDALVWGNYEAVMPLPWKKKWGFKYVYTPMFIQRLGVIGNNLEEGLEQAFYQQAARYFRFIDLMAGNPVAVAPWSASPRTNLVIPLDRPYADIRKQYSTECVKNLGKAMRRNCRFAENLDIDEIVALYRRTYARYSVHMNGEVLDRLSRWAKSVAEKGMLRPCGVVSVADHSVLFGALIFQCNKRLYYIAGAPTEAGRYARATYFFIDQLLQQFAANSLLFDFEGSDIPDVAAFYNRFGPVKETYYHLWYNKLPPWVRWMKKKSAHHS